MEFPEIDTRIVAVGAFVMLFYYLKLGYEAYRFYTITVEDKDEWSDLGYFAVSWAGSVLYFAYGYLKDSTVVKWTFGLAFVVYIMLLCNYTYHVMSKRLEKNKAALSKARETGEKAATELAPVAGTGKTIIINGAKDVDVSV